MNALARRVMKGLLADAIAQRLAQTAFIATTALGRVVRPEELVAKLEIDLAQAVGRLERESSQFGKRELAERIEIAWEVVTEIKLAAPF